MKKRLLILLSVCFICVSIFPSSPKYEMRAVDNNELGIGLAFASGKGFVR